MALLPIIYRELRAAARRRGTYRVRWYTPLIAGGVAFFSLIFVKSNPLLTPAANSLFTFLTAFAFLFCAFSGVFLTSDSLSLEKREGTLGLLFLARLKGNEIVLGKFAASSLVAFFGLVALLPVIAMPLLLGGLTWSDFARTAVALMNTMFVSLAAGIFVSSFMRTASRALLVTLGILIALIAGLPILER